MSRLHGGSLNSSQPSKSSNSSSAAPSSHTLSTSRLLIRCPDARPAGTCWPWAEQCISLTCTCSPNSSTTLTSPSAIQERRRRRNRRGSVEWTSRLPVPMKKILIYYFVNLFLTFNSNKRYLCVNKHAFNG